MESLLPEIPKSIDSLPGRGYFITFEGGDGVGKTTQIGRLYGALVTAGIDVVVTREPGGSIGAEELRRVLISPPLDGSNGWDPITETLLFLAGRRDHLRKMIVPALDGGTWVISDRFSDSTLAYQGYGHNLGRDLIKDLSNLALHDIDLEMRVPDLTIVLDLDVDEGLRRAAVKRGHKKDPFENLGREFHERVREGYLHSAVSDPARCALIDASGNSAQVACRIREVVAEHLGVDFAANLEQIST